MEIIKINKNYLTFEKIFLNKNYGSYDFARTRERNHGVELKYGTISLDLRVQKYWC